MPELLAPVYFSQTSLPHEPTALFDSMALRSQKQQPRFYYAEQFNSDLSKWDTSKVTDMHYMRLGTAPRRMRSAV